MKNSKTGREKPFYLEPGTLVRCTEDPDSELGTVSELIRQRNTDDLYRIDWQIRTDDDDLYIRSWLDVVDPDEVATPDQPTETPA